VQSMAIPGDMWCCGTYCNEKSMPGDIRQERIEGGKKATREMRITIRPNYSLCYEV
jgi:hypothetical protein